MSDIAIKVENLSKCYQIYNQPHDRLKQSIYPRLQRLIGQQPRQYFREFWALKDVSFEIKKGETVGIIGRNGSGKSTLLQMICGTLNPTSGNIQTQGRIAALLELGSGFNPEFTGRENVYMNAAVLGLSKEEIDARFDDIIAFADIGEFIEQPVKTYSSGMMVRLAFSVAINGEPEILIVDEALSVGDIAFQNKCIERLKFLTSRGVTILFVSHDLSTLQMICSHVFWLDKGHLIAQGDSVQIAQEYYVQLLGNAAPAAISQIQQQKTGKAYFTEISLSASQNAGNYCPGGNFTIRFRLQAIEDLPMQVFGLSVYRADGDWLIGLTSLDKGMLWPALATGEESCGEIDLSPLCLAPGDYYLALGAYSPDYSLCLALTDAYLRFSVRSNLPSWGKLIHPCTWTVV
ncbi:MULTISPECIES: ABC transporter ATP-binding protein [unclassified Methylomonas]|uniref:ABC transporter ATP-binding protein n=1 Tax=unclassified Methylomonas TaxID=2608980 RepID=UPI0008D964BF|nr:MULTISPECIES: ABC transporter ATP-binding protein [unclassified Methylomonas]NJA04847.1 ABC transporter ATP-binding protein [Methylococcaceae bacterium WWC4]OHX35256.1 ABC transporter ATP-binding protein [Methylomonas sp. LWB]WGS87795.1 ABC transporter ATP-binding protein [Methylomonas sp. UP202]